jgi:DNA-binding NarL/FixJ family response regulator
MGAFMSLRILVADDHEVVRRGLRSLLESHAEYEIIDEAATGFEVVQKANELKPDIVLMDITLPGLSGLEAAHRIRQALPQVQVLFLTVHDSEQMVQQALDAGARGYVLKSDAGRDLLVAVEAVRRRKLFFSPRVAQTARKPSTHPLTPREREVLRLLAEGKSTKEVATVLEVAVKTAETHRTNLMHKLGLHSVSDLVRYAIRNKVVEP